MYDKYDTVDNINLEILNYIEKNSLLDNCPFFEVIDAISCMPITNSKFNFYGIRVYRFNIGGKLYDISLDFGEMDYDTVKVLLNVDEINKENLGELKANLAGQNDLNIVNPIYRRENKDSKAILELLKQDFVRNPYIVSLLANLLKLDINNILIESNQKEDTDENAKTL